jgi:hypothetical protein
VQHSRILKLCFINGFDARTYALFTRLEKSLRLCLAGLRIRRFDPLAEASELPDHFGGALLLGWFPDRRARFFVTDSLMQDQPDQSTVARLQTSAS